ncbi:MAG: hypothetical protein WB765_14770 [Acidimicrobiales bacterium]|jgi:hypothetical protein
MIDHDQLPLADVEIHYLDSEDMRDEFKIVVGHRSGLTDEPPTVLNLTDANGMFCGVVESIRFMQLSNHQPPMTVVGIGSRASKRVSN